MGVDQQDRKYFLAMLTRRDAPADGCDRDLADPSRPFLLKLSHEHTGFEFVADLEKAAAMIRQHSGGHNSVALAAAAARLRPLLPGGDWWRDERAQDWWRDERAQDTPAGRDETPTVAAGPRDETPTITDLSLPERERETAECCLDKCAIL